MQKQKTKSEVELKLLKDLSLSIANAKDFNTALDICLKEICKATGWTYGEIWVASKDNAYTYISNAFYGENNELKEFYEESKKLRFTYNTVIPGAVWENKQPIWIKSIHSDVQFMRKQLALTFNLNSLLAIPILVNGNVIGVMVFFMSEAEKDEELVELLLAVVTQLSSLFNRVLLDEKLSKTNRALKVLLESNQAIIRATDELSLLNRICNIAVNSGGYRMALVAFAQHDKQKSIKIITHAGFIGDYIDHLADLSWIDGHPKASLSGKVIRTGKTYIVKDINNDPIFAPWRESALKHGFQSVISLPLIINHEVIGVLNMYANEVNAFDEEEKSLLEELADDIAYGIMTHRTRIENQMLQAQLMQSQKMEAIGQLAAGIAHDFNNILTAINGYSNLLYNKLKGNEELSRYTREILDTTDKAFALVQELLTFSRRHDADLKPLDINKTITNISLLLRRLLGQHVEMKLDLLNEPILIMGNKFHIEQVLMNLISNANDAMPEGGLLAISTAIAEIDEVFIKSHGFGKKGRFAIIKITDTGTGIKKDITEKIFDPFFTTKPVGKGSGLGLSVVYGIVKQHNGYIDVISEPGKGTTFTIYLPLVNPITSS